MIKKTLFAALVLFSSATANATTGWLDANQELFPGQSITVSCYFRATMGYDGNFVLTKDGDSAHVYWSSNTTGRGEYVKMQDDGNLVVYDFEDRPVWTAWTQGNPGSITAMQDDGNLVVYNVDLHPIWATNTAGPRLGSSQCHGNFNTVQSYPGWNAFGGDYNEIDVLTGREIDCAEMCATSSSCKTFTFVPAGIQSTHAQCWLKNGAVTWVRDNRMTSGIIRTNFSGNTF